MIFLFEEIPYKKDYLSNRLGKSFSLQEEASCFCAKKQKDGRFRLECVGYFFNHEAKEKKDRSIFILPKVFCTKVDDVVKAFDTEIPDDTDFKVDENNVNAPGSRFLSELSFWLYSAISRYSKLPDCESVIHPTAPEARNYGHGEQFATLVDVKNSFEKFYADNPNLFTFVFKSKHSGNNKIDWHCTMRKTPFLQGDSPIYMELVNKKKVFDLDDTLIVLYFSAMNYIEQVFGFKMPKSEFYKPLKVNEIERLLNGRGIRELRHIKHKYFADKFLRLYNIMEGFFVWAARFKGDGNRMEYLLANKFNNVFEEMIDSLVSDSDAKIQALKSFEDGKIIDHLYKEPSLIFADKASTGNKIWHIGDSKYYKEERQIEEHSIAKQYTYAKNIIQDFFNNHFSGNLGVHEGVVYRDGLTEGYNVTPNFFIRGFVPDGADMKKFGDEFKKDDDASNAQWEKRNRHFDNRLFDRDTLLLQVYNVNFLFVLSAYASNKTSVKDSFKNKARKAFRKNFMNLLNEKYAFWAIWPKETWDGNDAVFATMAEGWKTENSFASCQKAFVLKHGRMLAGKIFKPVDISCLILALEKNQSDDLKAVWSAIDSDCEMVARMFPSEILDDGEVYEKFRTKEIDEERGGYFVDESEFKEYVKKLDKNSLGIDDLNKEYCNISKSKKVVFVPRKNDAI